MALEHEERDPLDALAEGFLEAWRQGLRPSIEDYAARHPDLAADIRELFPTILAVEQAKSSPTTGGRPAAPGPAITRLGDFRIIREIGRGGMGVVYEAEQESLGRRVAIKVLPRDALPNSSRRERFAREARTAARLHHTNIVPIFGVGEQDGHHYFVMQYIRGVGLDAVFRALSGSGTSERTSTFADAPDIVRKAQELMHSVTAPPAPSEAPEDRHFAVAEPTRTRCGPSSGSATDGTSAVPAAPPAPPLRRTARHWRGLAEIFTQAADALAYAHAQSVLHRDVKPSNLLLDEDGALWIADFGLAKSVATDDLTRTGDIVGTLRYMAPEQFEGRADARSDVYSLGLTLYELATLTPGFATRERTSLMRAILDGALLSPRRLAPDLPRDLETIILKATARDPAHRYGGAADLRDDLRRFTEDRPIRARRQSAPIRLWRWARRNPALATTTALAFVSLAVVAVVASAAYFEVRAAGKREADQRKRAEATVELAGEAFESIFAQLAADQVVVARHFGEESDDSAASVVVPALPSAETAAVLAQLLGFYERLAEQAGDTEDMRLKTATARQRVGEIQARLGRFAEAESALQQAAATYEEVLAAHPERHDVSLSLARVRSRLGDVFLISDRSTEALAEFGAALALLRPSAESGPFTDAAAFELAHALYLSTRPSGSVLSLFSAGPPRRGGDPPEGGRGRRRSPETRRARAGASPPPPGAELTMLAPQDRRARLEEAVSILARLKAAAPEEPKYSLLQALCLRDSWGGGGAPRDDDGGPQRGPGGRRMQRGGRGPRGSGEGGPFGARQRAQLDEATALLEDLVRKFPAVPEYTYELAQTHARYGRLGDGEAHVDLAIGLLENLRRQHPSVPDYAAGLAQIYAVKARLRGQAEQPAEARAALERAAAEAAAVADDRPGIAAYGVTAAQHAAALAEVMLESGEAEPAASLMRAAVERIESLPSAAHELFPVRLVAESCYRQLAVALEKTGLAAEAEAARRKAEAFHVERPAPPPPGEPS